MSELMATFVGGVILAGLLAWLAISDNMPVPESADSLAGCTIVSSIKTDELEYCGKACMRSLYVNTYQCPSGQKVLIQ